MFCFILGKFFFNSLCIIVYNIMHCLYSFSISTTIYISSASAKKGNIPPFPEERYHVLAVNVYVPASLYASISQNIYTLPKPLYRRDRRALCV